MVTKPEPELPVQARDTRRPRERVRLPPLRSAGGGCFPKKTAVPRSEDESLPSIAPRCATLKGGIGVRGKSKSVVRPILAQEAIKLKDACLDVAAHLHTACCDADCICVNAHPRPRRHRSNSTCWSEISEWIYKPKYLFKKCLNAEIREWILKTEPVPLRQKPFDLSKMTEACSQLLSEHVTLYRSEKLVYKENVTPRPPAKKSLRKIKNKNYCHSKPKPIELNQLTEAGHKLLAEHATKVIDQEIVNPRKPASQRMLKTIAQENVLPSKPAPPKSRKLKTIAQENVLPSKPAPPKSRMLKTIAQENVNPSKLVPQKSRKLQSITHNISIPNNIKRV